MSKQQIMYIAVATLAGFVAVKFAIKTFTGKNNDE